MENSSKNETDAAAKVSAQQIYQEFQAASEQLLKEAKEILEKELNFELKKARRLVSLGFWNAKQAEIARSFNISIRRAERIQYYQFTYPNSKFVTEEQVEAICKKYNLVCGEVVRYKGFVPEANLRRIEKFTIREEDVPKIMGRGKMVYKLGFYPPNRAFDGKEHPIYTDLYSEEEVKVPLKICAPIQDMDMKGMTLEDEYKMKPLVIASDPIVLQPVEFGYLIVTAWGDEASDDLVVNEKHN